MGLVADRGDSGEQHEDQIKHLETHLGYPPRHHQHIRQHCYHYMGQESKICTKNSSRINIAILVLFQTDNYQLTVFPQYAFFVYMLTASMLWSCICEFFD